MQWGIDNENIARQTYIETVSDNHTNFQCTAAGLHVNPSYPHLGAAPDGVLNCDCCGKGVLEIKCPYKHREKHPHDVTDPRFYLKRDEDGQVYLSSTHEYYYQIQGQLAVCEKEYCDFVCWTPHGVHIEQILVDPSHCSDTKPALDQFFIQVLLPLLLTGKKISTSNQRESAGSSSQPSEHTRDSAHEKRKSYCCCDGDDVGQMIACDNPSCPKEWFHFECVGITRKPRESWYCSKTCNKLTDHS